MRGYQCGDRWWQYGNRQGWWSGVQTSLGGFRRCEDDLVQAAYNGTDWFQCKIVKVMVVTDRYVSFSPLGYQACFHDKHAPCKPETGEVYHG